MQNFYKVTWEKKKNPKYKRGGEIARSMNNFENLI